MFLFLALFVYVIYIFLLNFVNFKVRKDAVLKGSISTKYFKTFQGQDAPEEVVLHTRHHDNQYQAPLVFLIVGSLSLSVGDVSVFTVLFAWGFVLSRFMHSFFLLKNQNVLNRAKSFILGWFFILLMWGSLSLNFL